MLEIPRTESGGGSTAQPSPIATNLVQNPSLPTLMPETSLTFLLISGRRRTMSFPSSTTVGRVKELVWNSWPTDWTDVRPPAPNYLRILYLGKMLQDEDVLQNPSASPTVHSTIVHLSIRPIPPASEKDDLKKKKRRIGTASQNDPDTDGEQAGCCASCVIC
ncbi:ubiquitin-related domain-containing protein [Hysterangium stoloniferum]|nr:ubiquitin-related domain-containing protein [Hysterangium stoloniferum]